MRTQFRKALRSLAPTAVAALVMACTAAIAASVERIPASTGSPNAIVAPSALAPGSAQRYKAESIPRGIRSSRAGCPGCDGIGSAREVRMSSTASGTRRCVHHANSAALPAGINRSAENADLVILLDWHMNAGYGYGFSLDGVSCSAQVANTAPVPIDASEAYEMLARFRDGSGRVPTDTPLSTRRQGNPAEALPTATE